MKKILENLKNNKYITLFIASLFAFAYMGGARKYIYDNCSKIIDFARFGSPWFNFSGGMAILMAVVVLVGVAVAFLLRKKINMNWVLSGYALCGIISILLLILTPYNLQLLVPTTQLDTFATVTMISSMVFSLVIVGVMSLAISSHILIVIYQDKMIATIVSSAIFVLASMLAIFSVAFNFSLQIYFIVLTTLLILSYALNIFWKSSEDSKLCLADIKINWLWTGIIIGVAVIAIVAVLTSCTLVVEKAIAF